MASVLRPLRRPDRRGTRSYAVVRDSANMRRPRGTATMIVIDYGQVGLPLFSDRDSR
jgi:hypothetical protein